MMPVNNYSFGDLQSTFNSFSLHTAHFLSKLLKVFQLLTIYFQLSTETVEKFQGKSCAHGKNRLFWRVWLELNGWRAQKYLHINI
jgi:hypothetical protein